MHKTNFDLISDLYLDTLDDFTWENKATSLFCIVAGNISSDRNVLYNFLEYMEQFYEAVFFIDGDLEHDEYGGDFDYSYADLNHNIGKMDKVIFLHENIIILNNATLIATNGWTTFDFTRKNPVDETMEFLDMRGEVPVHVANDIFKMAITDQSYMTNSIEACQSMVDCQNLVVVTNSVPSPEFISHDEDYDGTVLGDTTGNSGILSCLENDTEGKVSTWIFGKYLGDLDYNIDGIRFVNNPGRNKDLSIYYPKLIKF
jgi:hypothetical protein